MFVRVGQTPPVDQDHLLPPTIPLPPPLQHIQARPSVHASSGMPWGALYSCSSGSRCPACRVPTRHDLAHTAGGNSVDLYHSDAVVNNHCYANTTMGTHRGHSETPPAASRRDVPGLWRQPFPASVARPADARGRRRQRSEATLERRRSRRGRPNRQSWSSQQHPRKFSHQRSARGGGPSNCASRASSPRRTFEADRFCCAVFVKDRQAVHHASSGPG